MNGSRLLVSELNRTHINPPSKDYLDKSGELPSQASLSEFMLKKTKGRKPKTNKIHKMHNRKQQFLDFELGEVVEAQWDDGHYYLATIKEKVIAGNYVVQYMEYDSTQQICNSKIRKVSRFGQNSNSKNCTRAIPEQNYTNCPVCACRVKKKYNQSALR